MNYRKRAAIAVIFVVLASSGMPVRGAQAQDGKGKVCRMEQQCRWENFKKICVYVKVCR